MKQATGSLCHLTVFALVTVCVCVERSLAASGAWTGAESAAWTNSANWSGASYPGSAAGETATLDTAGNGNTVLDLLGLRSIRTITFSGAGAAAYTLGTGGANGQTLTLESAGTLALSNSVVNSQTVNAAVLLGTNTSTATYTFQNDHTDNTLTFEGGVAGSPSGGTPGTKTLNLTGYGRILLKGTLANGGASRIDLNSYGTNTLSGNNTFTGNIVVVDGTLRLTHSGALGAGSKTISAANNVNGRNPSIVLDGSSGDLTIPASVTFNTSQSRAGAVINEAGNNTILGNFTLYSGDGATHIWSKGGKLTLAGRLSPTATDRQLYLRGNGDGEISGVITNGSTTTGLPVYRDVGTGTWTLSASNTYSGATSVSTGKLAIAGANGSINASSSITVNGGASLVISNTAAANHADRLKNTAPVTLNSASIAFANDGSSASFAETLGVLTLSSGTCTVSATPAAEGQASALTLSGLSRVVGAMLNFVGAGIGESDRNRIFISGLADGPVGPWATVNGTAPALYSSARGVYADTVSEVAAKGDVIGDGSGAVSITSEGTSGANELSASVTTIGALLQNSVFASAANTADKTLRVANVTISPAQADLTLGVVPNDGAVAPTTTGGKIVFANFNSAATLAVNAVIADNGVPSSLSKFGTGDVVLYGTNTLSGVVTIDQGAVRLSDSLALQSASLGSAGIVFDSSVASHAFTLGNLTNTFALPLTDSAANPLALSVGNNNASSSFGGAFSSSGSLHKVGSGTLTLTGTSTHNGGTTVSGGTLATGVAGGLGIGTVANDAVLNLTGGGITYTALGTSLSGAGTVNVTLGTGTAQTTLNGDFSAFTGTWNIGTNAAAGAGKAQMNGADNASATANVLTNATVYVNVAVTHNAAAFLYGGDTGESLGQLRLEAGSVWAGPVTLAGNISSASDGLLGGNSGTGTISGVISDLGGKHPVAKMGGGVLVLAATENTYAGDTSVRAGTLVVPSIKDVGTPSSLGQPATAADGAIKLGTGSTSARLAYTGAGDTTDRVIDMAGTTATVYLEQAGTGRLTFNSNFTNSEAGGKTLALHGSTDGVGELAGVYADGLPYTNKLIKSGTGRWVLSGANTYSGETEIQGGTLALTHPNAVSQASLLRFTGFYGALELAGPGFGETANNLTIGNGNAGTIISGVPSGSVGLNHTMGGLSLSSVTLNVARASGVLSGTPSVSAASLSLSAGSASTTTLNPTDADLIIGTASVTGNSYVKTLRLDGTSSGNMITGTIFNGVNTLVLTKANTSTWTLSGSNTYSGATTVDNGALVLAGSQGGIASSSGFTLNSGGTLCLSNTPALSHPNRLRDAATVTLAGGTLDFAHAGGAANYSETVGAVTAAGAGSIIRASQADSGSTSALTLTSLTRSGNATLNFTGTGLGEDARNRILINGQQEGLIGLWASCNGVFPALYSSALGVYDGSLSSSEIAARGPSSTLPDDAAANARITSAGVEGPITLTGASQNRVALLQQATGTPAVVATAGKTLLTHGVAINAGQASLTLGEAEGDGALTALADGGKVDLINDSASLLTVNAAISNNTGAVSLTKSGTGNVLLKGACSYSGDTLIGAGSLNFGSSATQALAGVISGPGALIKTGTNVLTLAGRNTYTGVTYINEGIVLAQTNQAFGSAAAGTVIASGATLDVGANRAANTLNLGTEQFTVSGAGVDGRGAIVNNSNISHYSAFGKIALAGDTTFGGAQGGGRFDIRNNTPTLDMNSFALTKVGPNMFGLTSATVNPGTGRIDVAQGTLRFESNVKMNGSLTNTMTVRSGATLELYAHYPQSACLWSLVFEDGATLSAVLGTGSSNTWAGPVTLGGTVRMTGSGSFSHTINGAISGPGSLLKYGSTTTYLTNDLNTYSGFTWITNGTVYASSIRAVGAPSSSLGAPATAEAGTIKLGGGTSSGSLIYTGAGDTTDRLLDLAGTTGGAALTHTGTGLLTFSGNVSGTGAGAKTLTLTVSTNGSAEISGSIADSAVSKTAITKNGAGVWTLSGNNSYSGDVNVAAGTLTLSGANAQGVGAMQVGSAAGNAVLILTPSASLTGISASAIRVGNTSGSQAALHMAGGTVRRTTSGTADGLALGRVANSYGAFNMSGGDFAIHRIQTGASTSGGPTNIGVFRMTGGTVVVPNYLLLARGVGSQSAFTVAGGTLYHTNTSERISLGYEGGRAEVNLTGGMLLSTTNLTIRQSANNSTGIVNLCSGTLAVNLFQNTSPGIAFLNFAGGTLKASTLNTSAFIPSNMTGVYSYGPYSGFSGGAVIDSAGKNVTVAAPLRAPAGQGVYAISLANPGSGYIGEPYIHITDGGGVGATAVANMEDDGTGNGTYRVASVTVTCPGTGYTAEPTVLIRGGGTTAVVPTLGGVTLSANTSGGLTKLGEGTLTLGTANTYTGVTTIAAGTLKLGVTNAIVSQSQIVLAGGTLDLSGFTVTNAVSGSGLVTNGTIQTILSPAGEGAIGADTLTLKAAAVKGTYKVDVTPSGASDSVAVQGNINLADIALEIVDTAQLDVSQTYTILTCSGTRTGTFSSTNLPLDSLWHVVYFSDGTVKLFYSRGTLIRLR